MILMSGTFLTNTASNRNCSEENHNIFDQVLTFRRWNIWHLKKAHLRKQDKR